MRRGAERVRRRTVNTVTQAACQPAILVLEDGRAFRGEAFGALGTAFGEAVFATGMTGYQETLTDPSYHRQVVVQTAPHIGNTGVNDDDPESRRIWVAGYVVRDPARLSSNWRSRRTLDDELVADGVVSNGPGDPATADYAVDAVRGVLDAGTPLFGICFGNQILGRALGLSTYKLRFGHRGVNQPVQDRATGRVHITSHNHGFAVQADAATPFETPYGAAEVSHV